MKTNPTAKPTPSKTEVAKKGIGKKEKKSPKKIVFFKTSKHSKRNLKYVIKNGFSASSTHKYKPKFLSLSTWLEFFKYITAKYEIRGGVSKLPIATEDIEVVLSEWIPAISTYKNRLVKYAVACVDLTTFNIDFPDEFDVAKEEFEKILEVQIQLSLFLSTRINQSSVSVPYILYAKKLSAQVKELTAKEEEENAKEWEKIETLKSEVQAAWFLRNFGIKTGWYKFINWKEVNNIAEGSGFCANVMNKMGTEQKKHEINIARNEKLLAEISSSVESIYEE